MRVSTIMLTILAILWGAAFAQAQDETSEDVTIQAYRIVNVRSAPGVASPVISTLNPGDTAIVLARNNEENDWLLIQAGDEQGWVAYFVVAVTGDLSTLPIDETAPEISSESLDSAFLPAMTTTGVSATAYRRVNVRSLPTVKSEVVTILERGAVIEVLARSNENSDWLQVETEAGVGWVAYYVVAISGDLTSLPVVSEDLPPVRPTATAVTDSGLNIITRYNVNLRSAPTLSAETLLVIPFDTELRATARNANDRWLRVEYDGETGWLLAALITFQDSGDIAMLPVAS
ncbi:MAG: SH3 domain-containing protein [Anaerolineae bacterium]|nr:SH3 domain-containing protein [Anaerolineae bacterium]